MAIEDIGKEYYLGEYKNHTLWIKAKVDPEHKIPEMVVCIEVCVEASESISRYYANRFCRYCKGKAISYVAEELEKEAKAYIDKNEEHLKKCLDLQRIVSGFYDTIKLRKKNDCDK
jgi:hypothetical protein